MDQVVSKRVISPEEMERRRQAVEQARAANIREGYTHDPVLEAANERFIRGEIDLADLDREMLAAIRAGH
jgi:hypothetical protein